MKLKHLDLFSGIGGFSLGLEATGGFETVAFCDIDKYSKKVLKKQWPNVKQYEDIKELNYGRLKTDGIGPIDIITGGYPCQPFSIAGRKKGEEDPRHLWPEYFRLIKELRPSWVIGENVSGHIKLGLDTVLENLESEGYSARTFSISASSVGAKHQRERIWIVANARQHGGRIEPTGNSEGTGRGSLETTKRSADTDTISRSSERGKTMANSVEFGLEKHGHSETKESIERGKTMADTNVEGRQGRIHRGQNKEWESQQRYFGRNSATHGQQEQNWWDTEPELGRVAHGIPNRVDRLKGLGNSLVPQIPYFIAQSILQVEEQC
jgi:DNA (cytosine-5)-methyltransferase 1|tara:strand:+ start:3922 stop:4890 length:969 start_codon:yes stop_codon:yes gene_type:complete